MILPASDTSFPVTNNSLYREDEFCDEGEDSYMTIENFQQSELLAIKKPDTLIKKGSPEMEKQISVDPISLKDSSMSVASPRLALRPVVTSRKVVGINPPPLPPVSAKSKFISASLPNSATSSPRESPLMKKKWKNQSSASPSQINSPHSPAYSLLALRQESYLQRSKSCGEGRASAPSDDFDLISSKVNGIEHDNGHHGNFDKIEADKYGKKGSNKVDHPPDKEFKCGAMCLFLPGFGKGKPVGKPVRPRKEGAEIMQTVISRTVSLERFECGSWSSSAIINDNEEDRNSVNLYFDLPLELIRTSVNDAHLPVTTAFVFDKDKKGGLKNGSTRAITTKSSHESGRHVRFSTSSQTSQPASPTSCITPRLRKAREEFNAFLEAQSA